MPAPFGIEDGYIFNAVLSAGGTICNYDFLGKQYRQHPDDRRSPIGGANEDKD